VDEIVNEDRNGSNDAHQVNQSIDSNPPLEFIKSIITILELDSDVQAEVHVLKRNLLAQIGVPEYSKLAEWKNPCPIFMLPDVFCVECHACRDLNVCSHSETAEGEAPLWACQDCGMPYDSERIERRLVEITKRRVIRYQLQDHRCGKTERIATRLLAKHSAASANWTLDTPREEIEDTLRLLQHIATEHDLEWLRETTVGLLTGFSYKT